MGSTKLIGKTIGEVEELTGIPKRKLKYMVERNLIRPSQRAKTGFWLYSEKDIQVVRSITLFQQLGYTEKDIRALLIAPDSQWPEDLEQQIIRLMERRDHIEDQLFLAELLRYQDRVHIEVADSGNHPAWEPGGKEALCHFLYQIFAEPEAPLRELGRLTERSPDDPDIQERIQQLCHMIRQRKDLSPDKLLLIFRLACTLSGLVPVLDALLCTEGAVQFITTAIQYYCEHQ